MKKAQPLFAGLRFALLPLLLFVRPASAEMFKGSFSVTPALRKDNFNWNIGGYLGPPDRPSVGFVNVLSELSWRDIKVQELDLAGDLYFGDSLYAEFFWGGGKITAGDSQDSDFTYDNRTDEFSRSNSGADMGETRDIRFGFGLPFGDPAASVFTPLLGWTFAGERLFVTDGRQTVNYNWSTNTPGPLGAIPGLDSHYDHQWTGVWLGGRGSLLLTPGTHASASARYHPKLAYAAEADWNLRTDLAQPKSFEHRANGRGWDLEFSVDHDFTGWSSLGAAVNWRRWRAVDGIDHVFFSDGTQTETQLNEVRWSSLSFGLTFKYRSWGQGDEEEKMGFAP